MGEAYFGGRPRQGVTLLVPFDGSDLAEAALVRATEFGTVMDEDVLAVSVIPKNNAKYARERGWLDPEAEYDGAAVVSSLHQQVTDLCPNADFRHAFVGRYAPSGAIARRVRATSVTSRGTPSVTVASSSAPPATISLTRPARATATSSPRAANPTALA